MSFPDGGGFAGFGANTEGCGSRQQPFLGTGMNSSEYPGFTFPMYTPQFPMPLPMTPYPTAGIYRAPAGKHTALMTTALVDNLQLDSTTCELICSFSLVYAGYVHISTEVMFIEASEPMTDLKDQHPQS